MIVICIYLVHIISSQVKKGLHMSYSRKFAIAFGGLALVAILGFSLFNSNLLSAQYNTPFVSRAINTPFDANSPTVGRAAPADVPAPRGQRALINTNAVLYGSPNGDEVKVNGSPLTLKVGDVYFVGGFSADGEWARLSVGGQSAWVRASDVSLFIP